MVPITTVIITKNEAKNIEACIRSAQAVSDDIVVVDCGSEDATATLAKNAGANVIVVKWQCYGHSRNTGAEAAKYDWILSLDADERVSAALAEALHNFCLKDASCVYKIKRQNYFAGKCLHFGTLGFESVVRLYNRNTAQWDLFPVHEKLQTTAVRRKIKMPLLHFGILNIHEHIQKKEGYAFLSAQKYLQQQQKATFVKRLIAPVFDGVKSYVFQLGFLDGKKGWQVAKTITYYTWLKYKYLHQLTRAQGQQREIVFSSANIYTSSPNPFFVER